MDLTHYEALDEGLYQTVLPNGLRVMVVPRKGFSRKLAYFVTDFGSIHTDFSFGGQEHHVPAGIAHYLEHKLFDMPGGRDVSAEFAALGAMTNAFTSYDMTAYYFSCTENFEECLKLLLEFVSTPYFTAESVEKERGIIDQEIGMNEDSPDSKVFEAMTQALYRQHPIRVPILGTRETIRQITPELLRLCHNAFYTPGNMMLCVMGDVDGAAVCRLARVVLGDAHREVGVKLRPWQEAPQPRTRLVENRMDVAMPMFSLAFKCPPLGKGEAAIRQEMAADLAAEVLFGESTALYQRLYEQEIIDSSFGGGFETVDGAAMLLCSGDSLDPEQVPQAILEEARRIGREGISESTFLRIRRGALGRRIRELDSFDSTCFRLCAYRMSDFDYFRFPGVYRQITRQEVEDLICAIVTPENYTISVMTPLKSD